MTGRYQKGEDLKEQGPRQGKQQIPLRRERISLKPSFSEEKSKREQHYSLLRYKEKKHSKALPFPSLGSRGHPPSHVYMCTHAHTLVNLFAGSKLMNVPRNFSNTSKAKLRAWHSPPFIPLY